MAKIKIYHGHLNRCTECSCLPIREFMEPVIGVLVKSGYLVFNSQDDPLPKTIDIENVYIVLPEPVILHAEMTEGLELKNSVKDEQEGYGDE